MVKFKQRFFGGIMLPSLGLLCSMTSYADDDTVTKASVSDASGITETAQFSLSKGVRVSYDSNGKLVMKQAGNGNNVAELPMSPGVRMKLSYSSFNESENSKSLNVDAASTFSSVFQIVVPEGVDVYAPAYDEQTGAMVVDESKKIAAGTVLPAGTGVIIIHNGEVKLAYSEDIASDVESCLTGSAVATPVSEFGGNLFTLGNKDGKLSFNKYEQQMTETGKAYFILNDKDAEAPKITLEGDATAITEVESLRPANDNAYNIAGQRLSQEGRNYKGIVIKNGKKYSNK